MESKVEMFWHTPRSSLGLIRFFFVFFLVVLSNLYAKEDALMKSANLIDKEEVILLDNPFKGLNAFTVFVASTLEQEEDVVKELQKIGTVKRFPLSNQKGIDCSGFTGTVLSFNITPIQILGEEKNNLIKVSILLRTTIEIVKTKNNLMAPIWLEETVSLKENIPQAICETMEKLSKRIKDANLQEKPIFYTYL